MLRIRLRRTGKKHQPHYRLVVAEHTAPITGKFIDMVGNYNPRTKELVVKDQEILAWLDKGAQPSNTVARLLTKQGMKHKLLKIHIFPERPGKKEQPEEAKAAPQTKPVSEDSTENKEDALTQEQSEEPKEGEVKAEPNEPKTEKAEPQKEATKEVSEDSAPAEEKDNTKAQ